jgi:5-methylcytosine-specific restriction endonuclease McrA
MPKELRDLVWDRDGGRCAICGQGLSEKRWECHHRKLRSQGGRDEPANLLALHPRCHSEAHDNRTWARERGYIVHPNTDPASRAVLRHGAHWQLPAAGRWVDTTAPEGFEENAA